MKLSERVMEQRLRSYLEDIGFISKYQSSFRQNKCTNDHLFRLSQSVMESFNRREHVMAAFLDINKLFTMFGTMDSGIKCCWLSDFPVGRVIQVNVNDFVFDKSAPFQGSHRVLSSVR